VFKQGNKYGNRKGKPKGAKNVICKSRLKADLMTWNEVEGLLEQNAIKLLKSKDLRVSAKATEVFMQYVKPKKSDNKIEGTVSFESFLNDATDKADDKDNKP